MSVSKCNLPNDSANGRWKNIGQDQVCFQICWFPPMRNLRTGVAASGFTVVGVRRWSTQLSSYSIHSWGSEATHAWGVRNTVLSDRSSCQAAIFITVFTSYTCITTLSLLSLELQWKHTSEHTFDGFQRVC